MVEQTTRDLDWVLGTFHISFFFATLFSALYISGALTSLLATLNTLIGTGVFVFLWLTTWWCTRQAVRHILPVQHGTDLTKLSLKKALYLGPLWGGINGVIFFIALLAIGILSAVVLLIIERNVAGVLSLVFFTTLVATIGSAIAFVVGALIGLAFTLVDVVLIAASLRLLPESSHG